MIRLVTFFPGDTVVTRSEKAVKRITFDIAESAQYISPFFWKKYSDGKFFPNKNYYKICRASGRRRTLRSKSRYSNLYSFRTSRMTCASPVSFAHGYPSAANLQFQLMTPSASSTFIPPPRSFASRDPLLTTSNVNLTR